MVTQGAVQVAQHAAGMPVPDWARLLRCTEYGARDADFLREWDGASGVTLSTNHAPVAACTISPIRTVIDR